MEGEFKKLEPHFFDSKDISRFKFLKVKKAALLASMGQNSISYMICFSIALVVLWPKKK